MTFGLSIACDLCFVRKCGKFGMNMCLTRSRDNHPVFNSANIFLHNSVDLSSSPAIIRICDGKYQMSLNWESTYAIALELRRQHPEINIEEVSLQQIYQWTIQLSEFEDDLSLVNDDILYAIYQDWFEENIHGK